MSDQDDTPQQLAGGIYAALATPRRADLMEADAAALLDYLDAVGQAGVDGLVLFGSTGEFIHFDNEERMRVLALAIRRSRVPVLVNVSHSTLQGAIQLADNAASAGAAGVVIMPPYYYGYADHQIQSFFEKFSTEIDSRLPRYLYNIPSCTNAISPGLAQRLLQSGAYNGIKDSSLDMDMFQALKDLRRERSFSLMLGHEAFHLEGRLAGADGIVSGMSAGIPELPVALDRAARNNRLAEAKRLQARVDEFLKWVEKFPATVAIKQCGAHRGWPLGHFAFPLGEQTEADLTAFRHWLDEWLPIVLAECA